ncbi:hypothetical protein [Variovorax sp. SCN 67-85]|nr:hypothetical protein [Variovorax sp. SCN 67-85]
MTPSTYSVGLEPGSTLPMLMPGVASSVMAAVLVVLWMVPALSA